MSSLSHQSLVARAQALFQAEAWADLAALLQPELEAEHRAPLWALQYGGAAAFHLGALQQADSLLKRAYQLRPQEG